jgi:hypothetical protein
VTDFERLLRVLVGGDVEFIIIGGFAATAHGSAHVTVDLDVVYRRTRENLERLTASLRALDPYLRGAPPDLPFVLDVETMQRGLNFTLTTTAGDLDLLGEVTGGGTYDALVAHTEVRELFELQCRFVDLPTLVTLKRAAGRPKDLERIAELEALEQERRNGAS